MGSSTNRALMSFEFVAKTPVFDRTYCLAHSKRKKRKERERNEALFLDICSSGCSSCQEEVEEKVRS